jgi:hypothetical protein
LKILRRVLFRTGLATDHVLQVLQQIQSQL